MSTYFDMYDYEPALLGSGASVPNTEDNPTPVINLSYAENKARSPYVRDILGGNVAADPSLMLSGPDISNAPLLAPVGEVMGAPYSRQNRHLINPSTVSGFNTSIIGVLIPTLIVGAMIGFIGGYFYKTKKA